MDGVRRIDTGAYGFFPFHGGRGWASFPSGHTAVIGAPAAVLWRASTRLRHVATLAVALVAIGLFGADYHFIGDIIAGGMVGVACGLGAETLVALAWSLRSSEIASETSARPSVDREDPARGLTMARRG